MPMNLDNYKKWFEDYKSIVIKSSCSNIERLIDIQPDGNANFCVDFPDYSIGNVKEATIEEVWNSKRAEIFREYRRKNLFAVCYKCGAKYMSELQEGV
ncbi:MAG: SPASM domain-containing protein [Brevinematia bacterium]